MDKQYTYLLIDILCIIIPLAASFHPRSPFYKEWKYYLPSMSGVAGFFLIWDALFTEMGIWGFNETYITGIKLYNLPIEEILFFICIPYACTYTYYVFSKYVNINFPNVARIIAITLIPVLIAVALLNFGKWYTTATFLLLSVLLSIMVNRKVTYLDRFLVVYLIILVPFFISNGILTGSWIQDPIVWYNNNHNLGLRMGTIPIEDAFYAILMLLMNIAGYEWLKSRAILKTNKLNFYNASLGGSK